MKKPRDWRLHAEHIVATIDKIERHKSLKGTTDPEIYQDALYRNLATIGESADELPDWLQDEYPNMPWRNIKDFRNVIVHDYLGDDIDKKIVNDVVMNRLPELRSAAEDMLKRYPERAEGEKELASDDPEARRQAEYRARAAAAEAKHDKAMDDKAQAPQHQPDQKPGQGQDIDD